MGPVLIQGQSDSGCGMAVQVVQVCFRVGAECRQMGLEAARGGWRRGRELVP